MSASFVVLAVGTGVVVIVLAVAVVVVVLGVLASLRGRDRSNAEQRHDARRDVTEAQARADRQSARDTARGSGEDPAAQTGSTRTAGPRRGTS
jgi:hypothetical protein